MSKRKAKKIDLKTSKKKKKIIFHYIQRMRKCKNVISCFISISSFCPFNFLSLSLTLHTRVEYAMRPTWLTTSLLSCYVKKRLITTSSLSLSSEDILFLETTEQQRSCRGILCSSGFDRSGTNGTTTVTRPNCLAYGQKSQHNLSSTTTITAKTHTKIKALFSHNFNSCTFATESCSTSMLLLPFFFFARVFLLATIWCASCFRRDWFVHERAKLVTNVCASLTCSTQ